MIADERTGAFAGSVDWLTEWRAMDSTMVNVPQLADEVAGVKFGDERLTNRLVRVVEALGSRPHDSIPAATATRAEMEGTYRFFANEKVTPELILSTHFACTRRRCSEQSVVLLVQDTTEVDLTQLTEQMLGAGPLDNSHRYGAFVHPLLAMDGNGVPLGLAWAKMWTRDQEPSAVLPGVFVAAAVDGAGPITSIVSSVTASSAIASANTASNAAATTPESVPLTAQQQKKIRKQAREKLRRHTPIEKKESMRWIEGVRQARDVADDCPDTTCVCIADSEGDIFELFSEPRETSHARPLELLIRSGRDRINADDERPLLETVRNTPVLYECVLELSARETKVKMKSHSRNGTRAARQATVSVRATTVTLRAPWRFDRQLTDQVVNVVLVEETNPPEGEVPVQWILLTTLPIDSSDAVRQIVAWYCERWGIEVYFRTLKSGCRIEERQFEFLDRELNFIAVSLIHAWRILLLCRLGRECPDMPCDVVFHASEWKAVCMVRNRTEAPDVPPRLNDMIRWIAAMGGHVIRSTTKANHPGTQTLWLGLQRVNDLAIAWNTYGPGKITPTPKSLTPQERCVVR